MIHIWRPLRRGWGVMQNWDVIGRRGVRGSECSGRPVFIFFIKEIWICAMTRHHAESNINILWTRNLPTDSGVREWSYPLMIPLHCLWTKSNNRTRGQFGCDATWLCFCFDFVCSHVRCDCFSIVCWRGWGGVLIKLDIQDQGAGKVLDVDGQGLRGLEN